MNQPDFERRLSRKEALKRLLSDGRWHGHRECTDHGGARFGARLLELRKEGVEIESKPVFGDVWEYRINPKPKQLTLL